MTQRRSVLIALILLGISLSASAQRGPRQSPYVTKMMKEVEIHRDTWGVPHIIAPNEFGAAMGMGFCQAEDYPELLPKLFTIAKGEGARYFGSAYEEQDVQIRTLNFYADSIERFHELHPTVQAILEGYAAGYNLWVESRGPNRDPWVQTISGPQVLAHGRVVTVLEFTLRLNGFDAVPPEPDEEVSDAVTEPDFLPGSNMWGIGKGRSESGHGLLLANPHLKWSDSHIFYEAHLIVPGSLNISGATLIGNPWITIGFNENLGWSHTVNRFDSHDVYEIEMDPEHPGRYMFDGISFPIERRPFDIQVKLSKEEIKAAAQEIEGLKLMAEANPGDIETRLQLAQILINDGRVDEGVEYVTQALELDPQNRRAGVMLQLVSGLPGYRSTSPPKVSPMAGRPTPTPPPRPAQFNSQDEYRLERHNIEVTHLGPVFAEKDEKKYVLASPNLDNIEMLEQWWRMSRAQNFSEFEDALTMVALPMFNIAYADREGNAFYVYNGRIPRRPDGYQWDRVIVGNDSRAEWTNVHPLSELPQLMNPKGDYVQNCNDAPWYTNQQQLIDKQQYPSYMANDQCNMRTQISLQMLEGDDSLTLEEIKEYKHNTTMLSAVRFKDELVQTLKDAEVASTDMKKAIEILEGWDNRADVESEGAVLFRRWFLNFQRVDNAFSRPWTDAAPFTTPEGIGNPKGAVEAMERAVESVKEKFGKLNPKWGDVHRIYRNGQSLPVAGSSGTFGQFRVVHFIDTPQSMTQTPGEQMAVAGDSYVLAVEFTDPPTAFSISAYGQTEVRTSPHHVDQSRMFANHEYKPVLFTIESIRRNAPKFYRPGNTEIINPLSRADRLRQSGRTPRPR